MKKIIIGTLMFLAIACSLWSALRTGIHDFPEDRCGDCHVIVPVKGDPRATTMKAPVSELCGRCHRNPANALSHPVEITPWDAVIPQDLPLSWDGKLTCSTCHDIHAAPSAFAEERRRFLRRDAAGRAFCEACHRQGVIEPVNRTRHSQILSSAHMEFEGRQSGRIDKISGLCLGCHDGSSGQMAAVEIGTFRHGIIAANSSPERSHPVGINYRSAMMKRRGLHPPETLDPKIRLVNGRVSCVSCHDLYGRDPKLLTVANTNSRLCLACHNK